MNIYFSGVGGVGIGPLAEVARDAGYSIVGSDSSPSPTLNNLQQTGADISFDQSGEFLRECHDQKPIDWFVYTAALPEDHPELLAAEALGLRITKRDELLAHIIKEKDLQLIAVAGTHGKTTVTSMVVWAMKRLGIPVSYSVGSTLDFGPSGAYDPNSKYFVYECDEFDRNFLHFEPHVSLIVSIDYDHPDVFPTVHDYRAAFNDFVNQSDFVISWQHAIGVDIATPDGSWILDDNEIIDFKLPGTHNRANATLVAKLLEYLKVSDFDKTATAIESFPGANRRFEQLADNLYSDYGHHPVEIAATLELANEINPQVVLVYQPHQNVRQHQIRDNYTDCMHLAETIYWLPTYLSREDPSQSILTADELTVNLENKSSVKTANLDDSLWQAIEQARSEGKLVLCMGAGSIDTWVRESLANSN